MRQEQRKRLEQLQAAGYDGWRAAVAPFPSPPCRCDRPVWWRDELGTRCVKCGRRRPLLTRARPDPLAE
jgi:hypothetical protein